MAHEAARPARSSAKVAAWSVLLTMGGTSVTLNIWDATHAAHLFWLIAGLKGLAPVLAAMFLSEAGARFDGGDAFRRVAFGIMAGAMILSASAVANVLRPSYPAGWLGLGMSWLFGIVLDAAALTGLWVILSERKRKADALTEMESAERTLAEAERIVAEAAGSVAEAERKAAEMEAELATTKAALEAERERRVPARNRRRSSGRKTARTSGRTVAPGTAPEPEATSAPGDGPDLDAEVRILALIAEGHSASQAGIMAGKSDSYGRQVARLAKAAKQEPAGDERSDGDAL